MKKVFFILLTIALVMSAPCGVMAQHHHGSRDQHHGPQRPPMMEKRMCATPEQMNVVMQTLTAQSFDDKKVEIAKLCVTIGHFCTDDLARMASVFSFDENRLEFLKYAYAYCEDPERYPILRDSFSFRSNYDALMDYIYPKR